MITIGDIMTFISFGDAIGYANLCNDEEDAGYWYEVEYSRIGGVWVISCWDDDEFIGYL